MSKDKKENMTVKQAVSAAKDDALSKLNAKLQGVNWSLAEANKDLDAISKMDSGIKTLKELAESVDKFRQSDLGGASKLYGAMHDMWDNMRLFGDEQLNKIGNELFELKSQIVQSSFGQEPEIKKLREEKLKQFQEKLQELTTKVAGQKSDKIKELNEQKSSLEQDKHETESKINKRLSELGFKIGKGEKVKDLRTFKARLAEAGKTLKKAFTGGKNPEKGRMQYLRRGFQKLSKEGGRGK